MAAEQRAGPLLKIQDLHVHYYTYAGVVHALNGANLEVREGEVVGLVGETGCGKSTMGHAIVGLITHPGRIIRGHIFFDGVDLASLNSEELREVRRTKISYVFQDPTAALNPVVKIGDQIAEAVMANREVKRKEALSHAITLLGMTGIPNPERVVNQYPHELSGGMRQRVMIAIGLAKEPKLIIADEPTSNLDVTIQAQILDLMLDLRKRLQTSILLITHDMGIVAQLCEKVAVMYAGIVVEMGPVRKIFKEPLHPYTQGLLRVVRLEGWRTKLESIPGTVPNLLTPPAGCPFEPRCSERLEKCRDIRPEFLEVEPGHWVACHLYPSPLER